MKRKIKLLSIAVAVVMLAAFFVACGDSTTPNGPGDSISLPTATLTVSGHVGLPFSENIGTVSITGNVQRNQINFRVEASSGALPAGLTLNATTGYITGTPTTAGNFSFRVEAFGIGDAADLIPTSRNVSITISEVEGLYLIPAVVNVYYNWYSNHTFLDNLHNAPNFRELSVLLHLESDPADIPTGMIFIGGTIMGTPTVLGEEFELTIRATLGDDESTATFTVRVIEPMPTIATTMYASARENAPYAHMILQPTFVHLPGTPNERPHPIEGLATFALSTAEDEAVLAAVGLNLHPNGLIETLSFNEVNASTPGITMRPMAPIGRPFADLEFNVSFDIDGFSTGTHTVRMEVFRPFTEQGVFSFAGRALDNATSLERYSTPEINANAPNRTTRYFLAAGSTLPQGFALHEAGMLYVPRTEANPLGVVSNDLRNTTHTVRVEARAEGQTPLQADFTFTIDPAFLRFPPTPINYVFTRNEAIAQGIVPVTGALSPITGQTPANVVYTFRDVAGSVLPRGLSIVDGHIVGTPERAYGRYSFQVTATAEGYTTRHSEVTIYIQEAIVNTNGVFNAEFTEMRGRSGSGSSGAASYVGMIQQVAYGARNGFYVGWHYMNSTDPNAASNPPFSFVFNSTAAVASAPLIIRLASETMDMTFNPTNFIVELNGTAINFAPFTVIGIRGGQFNIATFQDFNLGNHPILEGENVLRVMVRENNFGFYGQGAPGFDHIRFENFGPAVLTWRPHTYNLRGADNDFWEANAPNIF